MDEKTSMMFATILTIVLGIIGPIVAWCAGGDKLSPNNKEIVRQMLNFQITLIIVCFVGGMIPLLNVLVILAVWVAIFVYAIKSFNASNKNQPFAAPGFNFVK